MPTRRIFELTLVTIVLARPAFGLVHLWAMKQKAKASEGSVGYKFAEVVSALS